MVGSSGVGKSTMVNQLLGEDFQWTNDVNETTGKGRHTTTARELILLDDGGILDRQPGHARDPDVDRRAYIEGEFY